MRPSSLQQVSEDVKVREMSLDLRFWFLGEHPVRGSQYRVRSRAVPGRFARLLPVRALSALRVLHMGAAGRAPLFAPTARPLPAPDMVRAESSACHYFVDALSVLLLGDSDLTIHANASSASGAWRSPGFRK